MASSNYKTAQFKVATYLIRHKDTVRDLIADLERLRTNDDDDDDTLPVPESLVKAKAAIRAIHTHTWRTINRNYPETLVSVLWSALGGLQAYDLVERWLRHRDSTFSPEKDCMEDPDAAAYRMLREGAVEITVSETLGQLSAEEMKRVKLFLSWDAVPDIRGMPFGRIEKMSYVELTRALVTAYLTRAGYTIYAIMAIGRMDLAEHMVTCC